jgi:enterochelin esterase-like enzyme
MSKIDDDSKKESIVEDLIVKLNVIEKDLHMKIYLPPGYENNFKYPVLFLFHGNGASDDSVFKNLDLENKINNLIFNRKIDPAIIAVPRWQKIDLPVRLHLKFIKDLVDYIDNKYKTINQRDFRYLGGFSLGAQFAYSVFFQDSSMFCKIGGHMPALKENGWRFSTEYPESNPFNLVKNANVADTKFYLDCGKDDEHQLYIGCDKMYKILKEKKADVQNHLNRGGHTNKYLYENLESYLKFYLGKN